MEETQKYIPVRELPEEITSLPQEATVCSYCGVSYLIHHEIKRLEQELKESCERLNLLEAEDSNRAKEKRLLELNLKIKEEELAVKEECAVSLEKELHCLRAKYKESEVQSMCMKELKAEKIQVLHATQLLVSKVSDLKSFFYELSTAIKVDINDTRWTFTQLSSKWSLCQQQIEREMKALKHEVFDLDSTKNELSDKLHLCKQSLKSVEETLQETRMEMKSLLNDNKSLKEKLCVLLDSLQHQELENEHIRADGHRQLTAKSMEFERLSQEADRRITELNNIITSLSMSLKEKERQLSELKDVFGLKEKEMRGCLEHSEKQCKKLLEQLSVVKKGYDSQIAEMKLVCDQRITVLDRMLANKEQEFQDTFSKVDTENQSTISKLKESLAVAELKYKRVTESMQDELRQEKSVHDQEISYHLQRIKELEIRLAKEKDEAVSKVLKMEQELLECGTKYTKLDKKLVVAYNEISTLQAIVQRQCEERENFYRSDFIDH